MSGVRGSGVEGGLRAVPRGRSAKKKTQRTHLFNLGEKWKKAEKRWKQRFLYTPKSDALGAGWKMAEKRWKQRFCIPLNPAPWSHFRQYENFFGACGGPF